MTPVRVGGGDRQNVVSLQVDSSAPTADIVQFMKDGKAIAAIDSKGRLRLGGIPMRLVYQSGVLKLVATLPNGQKRSLTFR